MSEGALSERARGRRGEGATNAQRRVLAVLVDGGALEHTLSTTVLRTADGQVSRVPYATFWALRERGWVAQGGNAWVVSEAGRACIAR